MSRSYPGGKNGAGVYQAIINQMPPHDIYIEAFVGGGAVYRNKRPARSSIVIDADAAAIAPWQRAAEHERSLIAIHGDAMAWLEGHSWTGRELVYCDPPYLHATRVKKKIYAQEMDDADHARLLAIIRTLPCAVMISGYAAPLYVRALRDWRLVAFPAVTRGHTVAIEHLWCNFPAPIALHDCRYLGNTFRERELVKRKAARWKRRFDLLSPLERQAILSIALAEPVDARAPPETALRDLADHR